ncbi:hypothetical protein Pmar_PMAR000354, partial [Perkinsus marinus ATCC 50983]
MATPEYVNLVPPANEFIDSTIHADLIVFAKDKRLDRIKQALSNFRRRRTLAHNAVQETRRMLRVESMNETEKAEQANILEKQTSVWADNNKVLEKIEEALEYANVFDDLLAPCSTDDEGWVTTTSSLDDAQHISPRGGHETLTTVTNPDIDRLPGTDIRLLGKGVTTQTVNKVELPKLKYSFSLQHHLKVCENMLIEAEVGQEIGGNFQPVTRLRYNVVTKILGTLVDHKDIFQLASDAAEQSDHDWSRVKTILLNTHAKRETLIEEYRANVLRVKYSTVDKFCADARRLFAMVTRLFGAGNTYERRGLIETLV